VTGGADVRSIRRRLIVTVALSVAFGFAATAFLVWRIVSDSVTRDFDARLSTALAELVAATDMGADGILSLARNPSHPLFGEPRSGWYWSIARGNTTLARSRSLLLSDLPRPDSVVVDGSLLHAVAGPNEETLRIRYRAIAAYDGADALVAAAAGPVRTIGMDIRTSMQPVLMAMAIAGIFIVLLIVLEIRHGLKPLEKLAGDVERAARGEIDRIPQSGHRELAPLSAGINNLIDQIEATVERARLQAANLAHAIKTPLTLISARNEKPGGMKDADISLGIETIRRQIDHQLKRARIAGRTGLASEPVSIRAVVDDIVLVMRSGYRDRSLSIAVAVEPGLVLSGEREDVEEMLGNLIDNACKWARRNISVEGKRIGGELLFSLEDDGPGVPEGLRQEILKRGQRLDESVPGSGLGLAIADDIARLYGGTLTLMLAASGGLRAELRFPASAKQG
jgi:signal transduction histidine kinase